MSNYDDKLRGALLQFKSGLLGFEETIALINTIVSPKEESVSYDVRLERFKQDCGELLLSDKSNSKELSDFFHYWSERTPKAKLMKFEKLSSFDIKRRYSTWKTNQKKFSIAGMLSKGIK